MSKNAMAGAITLCGVGLCTIGGGLMMQSGSAAHAGSMPAAAAAVAAATHSQTAPTIVWYQVVDTNPHPQWPSFPRGNIIFRAWSDGTIEARVRFLAWPGVNECVANPDSSPWLEPAYCGGGWKVVSSPTEGFRAAADSNADEKVDGIDLASVLSNWGDAPRVPFPPSDCPLNLINP